HGLNESYSPEELMEMAVSSKVDGIMVLGSEEEEMTALIDRSADMGIPVVTMYSDSPGSKRCSFVGVSAFNIGREYGRQIISARNEKIRIAAGAEDAGADVSGPVSVTVFFDDNNRLYDQSVILSGINDALSREAEDAEFVIRTVAVDNGNPFSVEESMRDVFMDEEVPDIIVCLSELDTTCAYQAAIDHNMVGNVYILGYYDSEKILNALSRNVIYSTLAVDTSEMGRYCVEALNEYVDMGNTSQYFSTDVTIIDRSNVSTYLKSEGAAYE
ncbi:MAG: substrate-binding domain-containing protein, partial [Lachnospiraceae bacterium]|nr:substrate-binding domain-containing protein [Lachnospiraceae bacterium]